MSVEKKKGANISDDVKTLLFTTLGSEMDTGNSGGTYFIHSIGRTFINYSVLVLSENKVRTAVNPEVTRMKSDEDI